MTCHYLSVDYPAAVNDVSLSINGLPVAVNDVSLSINGLLTVVSDVSLSINDLPIVLNDVSPLAMAYQLLSMTYLSAAY